MKTDVYEEEAALNPKTMQAVTIEKYGGNEVLKVDKIPAPEAGPGEVRIKVEAAGVGVWDQKLREGRIEGYVSAEVSRGAWGGRRRFH